VLRERSSEVFRATRERQVRANSISPGKGSVKAACTYASPRGVMSGNRAWPLSRKSNCKNRDWGRSKSRSKIKSRSRSRSKIKSRSRSGRGEKQRGFRHGCPEMRCDRSYRCNRWGPEKIRRFPICEFANRPRVMHIYRWRRDAHRHVLPADGRSGNHEWFGETRWVRRSF
jgi:hypothetical protein